MIKIISDDACDLTKEEVEKYDIDIVHFKISDEDGNDIENVEKLYEMELNNPKMRFFPLVLLLMNTIKCSKPMLKKVAT